MEQNISRFINDTLSAEEEDMTRHVRRDVWEGCQHGQLLRQGR